MGEIKNIGQTEKTTPIQLKPIDRKILSIISQDARESIVDIAFKLKKPIHIASYHLKNLMKSGVIEGFKPKININKLGLKLKTKFDELQIFSVSLYLRQLYKNGKGKKFIDLEMPHFKHRMQILDNIQW